jgi:hypothetical protein
MANTFKKIATTVLSSTGSTVITMSSIPSTYDDLVIYTSCRAASGSFNTGTDVNISVNGGSGTFAGQTGYSYATTLGADTGANRIAMIQGDTAQANGFAFGRADFVNYSSSTANKQFYQGCGWTSTTNYYTQEMTYGKWSGTDPITSITFTSGVGNFATGTTITLYGVKRT